MNISFDYFYSKEQTRWECVLDYKDGVKHKQGVYWLHDKFTQEELLSCVKGLIKSLDSELPK